HVIRLSLASSRSLALSPARRGIWRAASLRSRNKACHKNANWMRTLSHSLPALDPQVDLHPFTILLQNPVILAQRIALPPIGQQNAFHVRMPVELDPE